MLNPYLADVDAPIDPTGAYSLPLFQDDMVLRAKQLNTQFGFLLAQDQASRCQLAGVGVVTGLQPRVLNGRLSISAGYGVTSAGDLLHLDAQTYTQVVRFEPHPDDRYFKPEVAQNWAELVVTPTDKQEVYQIGELDTEKLAVVLYYEAQQQQADNCTGVGCDQAGAEHLRAVRVLLVPTSDVEEYLLDLGYQQAANAYNALPVLPLARLALPTETFYGEELTTMYTRLDQLAGDFRTGLVSAFGTLNKVPGISAIGQATVQAWGDMLTATLGSYKGTLHLQYCYAWLKDLYEAYEEFRQATAQWLVTSSGLGGTFAQHLVLGTPSKAESSEPAFYPHRHVWLRAAATDAADAHQRAVWLFRRLGRLIQGFPKLKPSFSAIDLGSLDLDKLDKIDAAPRALARETNTGVEANLASLVSSPLRITPDYTRAAPFDQRSLPFYYSAGTRAYWSYAKTLAGRSADIHSYHRTTDGKPAYIQNPFSYQVEDFTFYRVEGLQGVDINAALQQVASLRKTYNLAFDVVAVRHDAKQPSLLNDPNQYADLSKSFTDAQDLLRQLVYVNNGRSKEQVFSAPASSASLTTLGASVAIETIPKEIFLELLVLPTMTLATTNQAFLDTVADFEKQILPSTIASQLRVVKGIWAQYQSRAAQLATLTEQLTLPALLAQNPGMERGCGVPRGGTLVLVYSTQDGSTTTPLSTKAKLPATVVADYYLPYQLVSTTDAPVQFLVGELPVVEDDPVKQPPAPEDGPVDQPAPEVPSTSEPAPEQPVLKPYAKVEDYKPSVDREQKLISIDFSYACQDGKVLYWDFGDDTPIEKLEFTDEVKPGTVRRGTYRHVYDLNKYRRSDAFQFIWLDDMKPEEYGEYYIDLSRYLG